MTNSFGLRSAVCAAALLAGTAAHADLTAAQVWEDWKSQLGQYGEENLTIGAEETSSGTVTVRDITLSLVEEDVVVEMTIEDITFNEQSDGSVRVTMDESYPLTITSVEGVVVTIMMTQSNLEMVVSGDSASMDYAIRADSYEIAFQDAVDGDVTINGDARVIARDLAGSYNVSKIPCAISRAMRQSALSICLSIFRFPVGKVNM